MAVFVRLAYKRNGLRTVSRPILNTHAQVSALGVEVAAQE